MAAGALPWLIFAATVLIAISIKTSMASGMAKPGCQETCDNVTIPYPFGIGPGCYREGFEVSCKDNTTFMGNASSNMKIYDIDLPGGQAQVNTSIARKCFNDTSGWEVASSTNISGSIFTISSDENMLTAIGCNTIVIQNFEGSGGKAGTCCQSMCADNQSVEPSGQCSGHGCCETYIAPDLTFLNITFDGRYNNSEVRGFNPCSYAFVTGYDFFDSGFDHYQKTSEI